MKLELLMAVVHNSKAAYFSSLIQSHKANLQLTVPAKGTTHLILDYLGLTEKPKSLIVSIVRADQAGALIELSGDVETAYDIYYETYDIHELPAL